MKRIFTFALLATVAAMIACTKTPAPDPDITPPKDTTSTNNPVIPGYDTDTVSVSHYILAFIYPKSFSAHAYKDRSSIWINYDREHYSGWYLDDDQQRYTTVCERYGDMTYNKDRIFTSIYTGGFDYLEYSIASIDVVSETNYDAEHPAGSSLNDICVLEAESPYKHIKSGYTLTHDWPKAEVGQRQKDKGSIPFSKPLTECTAGDMTLMGNGSTLLCKLNLTKLPTSGTKQLITITLTEETGKTYTTTTEPFTW